MHGLGWHRMHEKNTSESSNLQLLLIFFKQEMRLSRPGILPLASFDFLCHPIPSYLMHPIPSYRMLPIVALRSDNGPMTS